MVYKSSKKSKKSKKSIKNKNIRGGGLMKPELDKYLESAKTGTNLSIYEIIQTYFDKTNIDRLEFAGGFFYDYFNNINTFFDDLFNFFKNASDDNIKFKTRPMLLYNELTYVMQQFYNLDINMNITRHKVNNNVGERVDEQTLKRLNELESFSDKEFLRKKCKNLIDILIFICDNPIKKELTKYNKEMIAYNIYPYYKFYGEEPEELEEL